jgi:hypothetical protein
MTDEPNKFDMYGQGAADAEKEKAEADRKAADLEMAKAEADKRAALEKTYADAQMKAAQAHAAGKPYFPPPLVPNPSIKAKTPEQVEAEKKAAVELAAAKVKHDAMLKKYAELQKAHYDAVVADPSLLESYLAHEEMHAEAVGAMPKRKPEYIYADDECRPVAPNGTCPHCGWVRGGKRAEDREPHAVQG